MAQAIINGLIVMGVFIAPMAAWLVVEALGLDEHPAVQKVLMRF